MKIGRILFVLPRRPRMMQVGPFWEFWYRHCLRLFGVSLARSLLSKETEPWQVDTSCELVVGLRRDQWVPTPYVPWFALEN